MTISKAYRSPRRSMRRSLSARRIKSASVHRKWWTCSSAGPSYAAVIAASIASMLTFGGDVMAVVVCGERNF